MQLLHVLSNKEVEAEIDLLSQNEFYTIGESKRFEFDWLSEMKHPVYKIYLVENGIPLGLIALADIQIELRININLIEVSSENIGRKKDYDKIAGCLLAFAAREAFKKGYEGFISLLPKTQLIDLYCSRYGFQQYGRYLALEGASSFSLIQTYLK